VTSPGGAGNTPSVSPSQGSKGGDNLGNGSGQVGAGGGGSSSAGVDVGGTQINTGSNGGSGTWRKVR
jgi:hypothetical protein